MREPAFTLGVEEEYLLVHAGTGELDDDPPAALFEAFTERLGEQVNTEFLRSQVEVETRVCRSAADVRDELMDLRRAIAATAAEFERAPLAVSTHPFGRSRVQKPTEKDRYVAIAEEVQAARRHMLICGMHVHVGLEDPELRLDLLNQLAYFLPHLLALSTSSPFFEGENTGFRSFRLNLLSSLPRAGLPERFASWQDYQRNVNILVGNGVIPDTSKIWWDLRPSWRYPTLEVRIMDMCTSVEDAVTLAALVQSLTRMLWRLRAGNQQWRVYSNLLIGENRWRAMRYGCDEPLLDLGRGELVPFRQLAEEIVELVREDADALGCLHEVERIREIAERGTSAHRQVRVFESARERGAEDREALEAVVRSLTAETMDNVTA